MKELIKQKALDLGFEAVGIARPEPQTWHRYDDWLKKGYHGEMHYLERRNAERKSTASVLPNESRDPTAPGSVIVLAQNYHTIKNPQPLASPSKAIFSSYAWGDDYHEVVGARAKELCAFIRQQTHGGHAARWCVDTAPVLERDFAAQAGIGWFGKHANILSQSLGNFFFLSAIATTLELEPDSPATPHCGTCSRCMDCCPTDAFAAPYVLDARRCISYLTIELKGPIPRELRPLIGRRVFGCDDCLAVCPWNRFAPATSDPRFQPREHIESVELIELMGLDDDGFRKWFKNSPVKRAKRRGLLRNAAVALGNVGDPESLPVLIQTLGDHEPLIRGHSAWALGIIGGKKAQAALATALEQETDSYVQEEIQWARETLSA